MDLKQYKEYSLKKRTKHILLPSGLEFDIVLPPVYTIVFELGNADPTDDDGVTAEKLLSSIKLPDDLTVDDFLPEDFVVLVQQVTDFFAEITTSLNGSKNMQNP